MVAGVDVGGTSTKSCIVAGTEILSSAALPTTLGANGGLGDLAVSAVNAAAAEAGHRVRDLDGIGIGVPGQVWSGQVSNAANLGIGERGFDLADYVNTATGIQTTVENDMTVAAYGAFKQMSAEDPTLENIVYIGLGTGVSAGVVIDRKIFRGRNALAGEFGHVDMGTGLLCACGSVGCLETVVGANGLRQAWTGGLIDTLFDSAASGDASAKLVVDRAVRFLATAMWWLAAAYDPDCLLIGGGLGANNPSIKELIAVEWAAMSSGSALARKVLDPERILISNLVEPVGAYGAALLAVGDAGRGGETNPDRNWEEERRK